MSETEDRTPSEIVAAAEYPAEALCAFIAQELEQWGFEIRWIGDRTICADSIIVMTEGSSAVREKPADA